MTGVGCAVLVVAKAPVAGLAKTRLAADVGPVVAAGLAAAALLDTLDTVRSVDATAHIVALTGDLALAQCADEIIALSRDGSWNPATLFGIFRREFTPIGLF